MSNKQRQQGRRRSRDKAMGGTLIEEEVLLANFIRLERRAVDSRVGGNIAALEENLREVAKLGRKEEKLTRQLQRVLKEKQVEAATKKSLSSARCSTDFLINFLKKTIRMDLYVAELEEQFSTLVTEIDDRACDLIETTLSESYDSKVPSVSSAELMQASQNAITSLRQNWAWLHKLTKCTETHLEKASDYHLFYQTVTEYKRSLEVSASSLQAKLNKEEFAGDHDEAKQFYSAIQDLLSLYLQWWQRVDTLVTQSRKVFPIRLRRAGVDMKRPAVMLVDFESKGGSLKAGESVFIVNNQNRKRWIVETLNGQRSTVPSICVLICGPETEAVEKASMLRVELLASWTVTMKELGKTLIGFMLAVFRRWNKKEALASGESQFSGGLFNPFRQWANTLQCSLEPSNKQEIMTLLRVIEEILQSYWADNPDFEALKERMRITRAALIIYEDDEPVDDRTKIDINTIFLQISPIVMLHGSSEDESNGGEKTQAAVGSFIVQKRVLSLLLNKYEEFHKYWEVYKVLVESSNDSHFGGESGASGTDEKAAELLNFISGEDKEVWSRYINMLVKYRMTRPATTASDIFSLHPTDAGSEYRLIHRNGVSIDDTISERSSSVMSEIRLHLPSEGSLSRGGSLRVRSQPARPSVRPSSDYGERHVSSTRSVAMTSLVDEAETWQKTTFSTVVNREEIMELQDASMEENATVWEVPMRTSRSPSNTSASKRSLRQRGSSMSGMEAEEVPREWPLIIASVSDTITGEAMPFSEAENRGLAQEADGIILDRRSRTWMSLSDALSAEVVTLRQSTGYGYLTVLHLPPSGFVIQRVADKMKRTYLTAAEARREGILDDRTGHVLDTQSGRRLTYDAAIVAGILHASFDSTAEDLASRDRYLVRGVMDPQRRSMVAFRQAVTEGLIDKKKAIYRTEEGDFISLMEAIHRGGLVDVSPVWSPPEHFAISLEDQMKLAKSETHHVRTGMSTSIVTTHLLSA